MKKAVVGIVTLATSFVGASPHPVLAQSAPLAFRAESPRAVAGCPSDERVGFRPTGALQPCRDPGPNGWLVVGGLTVAGAVFTLACCRHGHPWFPPPDSTSVSPLGVAAVGALMGMLVGGYVCLRVRCSWGKPRLPRSDFTPGPVAAVYLAPGRVGVRLRW